MLRLSQLIAVLSCSAALAGSAWSDAGSIAAEARRYQFDLRRNFFPSPAAERAARTEVLREAEAVNARAAALNSAADLLAGLEAEDRMLRLFRRHDLYLFLRYATDIRREGELAGADELRAPVRAARQALQRAILARDPGWLDAARRDEPGLARYRFYVETLRRNAAHALSPEQQGVAASLEPLIGAGADYPRVVSGLRFGAVEIDGRSLDAARDRAEIQAHPSPEVRREGARQFFAGYAAQRDLLAFMLVRTIEGSNAMARLRGHASAAAEAAFNAYVTEAGYEAMLAEVASHGGYYKDWQRRGADPLATAAQWRPSRASAAVVESAGLLGAEYRREFAALLDRTNGRADLGSGEHRLPLMGTASVYPIGVSAIYMQAYQGALLDLVVLAHEGGHAVQAQLMYRNGVPMAYAAGPGYFTESFGRFQELLLLDHLHRTASTAAERAQFRDALAARLMAVFPSAEEAAVELAIHRGVADGGIRGADQLDAAALAAGAPYSLEYERTPERRGIWMLSEGYFMAPMQELDDAYSSLLAVRYFELYRRDPERFRSGYVALLSGGYDDEPRALLLRNLGFDMMAPEFAAETMTSLRGEVEALYRG
jgi:oligoendopeptidase F